MNGTTSSEAGIATDGSLTAQHLLNEQGLPSSIAITAEHVDGGETVGRDEERDAARAQQVKRRISRACDRCNASRRKCDGKKPCGYCIRTFISIAVAFVNLSFHA